MTMQETKTLIDSFGALPVDVQHSIGRFLVGAKLDEIVKADAHGVTEIEVNYIRHGAIQKLIWDDTTKKLLGGTEPVVIQEVLDRLSPGARQTIQSGGSIIKNLKIKHDDRDDHEYLHVHYVSAARQLSSAKFELDGSPRGQIH